MIDHRDWVVPNEALAPGVRVITTTRSGGCSRGRYAGFNLADHVGDEPADVARNRRELLTATGCDAVQWLQQVHGTDCIEATGRSARGVPRADAAWTGQVGLAMAVLTADCVPVVLSDTEGSVVAVVHAGWRGLVTGVLAAAIAAMPVPARALRAWLGPAIGPERYQIGPDVADAVTAALGGLVPDECRARILRPDPEPQRWRLDLFETAGLLLAGAGVMDVRSERLCTASDRRFYSYRRDGETGRMATLVWRERREASVPDAAGRG